MDQTVDFDRFGFDSMFEFRYLNVSIGEMFAVVTSELLVFFPKSLNFALEVVELTLLALSFPFQPIAECFELGSHFFFFVFEMGNLVVLQQESVLVVVGLKVAGCFNFLPPLFCLHQLLS